MSILKKIESEYGEFSAIRDRLPRDCVGKFSKSHYEKLKKLFVDGEYLVGVEWIARHYLASKKISLAALYFTQSETLQERGMKNLSFYACYYSLFSALSANMLLNADFRLDKVRTISHSALARDIENYFVKTNIYDREVVSLLEELRFCRELYSYHLPISGDVIHGKTVLDIDSLHVRLGETLPICLQMSDMQSYLSYYAWEEVVGRPIDVLNERMSEVDDLFWSIVQREGPSSISHNDRGDYMLLGYFLKTGKPIPMTWLINEKVLEEVECAWEEEECDDGYQISSVAQYLSRVIRA
ncbi:hypothetical protein [Pseudomonas sp. URMO17WK12:I11]|uniref:hypothetical protein n=1 Tax=Pseudomonas sp. URMO17WK12:I11 TaxID=1283291 RepID=UPI0018D93320|nr:hypothetical protein [Pseudomonas sp. URMO17WK12:I11]MBH3362208.1 hypothetical protein [Pseudomonas sp. URMO17WK12:I11]